MSKALEAWLLRRDELDCIDIRQVARAMGCVENQDNDPTKWKMPNGSNFWFKQHSQGWMDLNNSQGGQGAVRLLKQALGLEDDKSAMAWLSERFTDDGKIRPGVQADPSVFAPREEKQFRASGSYEEYIDEVMQYLAGERGIPPALLRSEIKAGRLYATRRDVSHDQAAIKNLEATVAEESDVQGALPLVAPVVGAHQGKSYNNNPDDWKTHCAFISRTAGELRCVEKSGFKGTMPGSQSDEDVAYTVPHQKSVAERLTALVEAAVDCQSYSALLPGRITSSTNGAYRFTLHLRVVLEALSQPGFGARLAFDADEAGDIASQKVFNALYASKAIAHRYQLDVQDVEEWFLSGHLNVQPDASPHTLFFGNGQGFATGLPVLVKEVDKWTDDQGKPHIKTKWVPTDKIADPTVIVRVNMPIGPFEKGGETLSFKVSPAAYGYVVNELDVRRDRPLHGKDWNEELLRLGSSYVRDYERCAEEGFKRVPALPADMEVMRDRSPIVITSQPGVNRAAASAPPLAKNPPVEASSGVSSKKVPPGDRPRFQRTSGVTPADPVSDSPPQDRGPARRFHRP